MATFNEWCLYTIRRVRVDISPGVSGWNRDLEGQSMRTLLANAQFVISVPEEERLPVRNRVAGQIADEIPGTGNESEKERAATTGRFGAAIRQTENHFQALVDEDNEED